MRQLIYSSRCTDAARQDIDLTLQDVVRASIQNNRMVDITGFLLSQDGQFIQVLEGPARAVGDTFKRISGDARHDAITVLSDTTAERRLFQQWNMAGVQGGEAADRVLDGPTALAALRQAAERQLAEERLQALD